MEDPAKATDVNHPAGASAGAGVLTIGCDLPPGVLLGAETAAFAAALAPAGAHWLSARPAQGLIEGDEVTGWALVAGGRSAIPAHSNAGRNAIGTWRGHSVIALQTGRNGGFVVPDIVDEAGRFSLAVIYAAPDGDARTLGSLTLGPEGSENLFFLSHSEGTLVAKDRAGGVTAEIPVAGPQEDFRLAITSWDGARLLLSTGGAMAEARGTMAGAEGPVSLFVGCRGHRRGLQKTLGAARIAEVIFWPGRALLAPRGPDDHEQRAAVERYFRWQY